MQRRKAYMPDRLVHDVTGISVTVNKGELEGLLQIFRASGYAIRKEGEKQTASGPGVTFTLLPEMLHAPRIPAFDLSLNREKTGGAGSSSGASGPLWDLRLPSHQSHSPRSPISAIALVPRSFQKGASL
jgi:hypothetical protein